MKVRCIGPLESDIRDENGTPAFMHPAAIGAEYTVRAMALMNNKLAVFLVSETGWPTWFPVDRFVVVDAQIPAGWEFTTRTGFISALWGYPTLIRDRDRLGALYGRRESAREAFLRESGVSGFDKRTGRFIE
ncbi:hypothetical protein [Nocardia sp. NPDC050710]|uniref:hypothetical protein n=1 Tax=Nocardia sp. NPDC050710 TaxID=3157220 RepID=UPI00341055B4